MKSDTNGINKLGEKDDEMTKLLEKTQRFNEGRRNPQRQQRWTMSVR